MIKTVGGYGRRRIMGTDGSVWKTAWGQNRWECTVVCLEDGMGSEQNEVNGVWRVSIADGSLWKTGCENRWECMEYGA